MGHNFTEDLEPDNISLLLSGSNTTSIHFATRAYIYTISFLLVFISFTLGGAANVYALWKLRGIWSWCPLLCNLAFVGALACLLSAPLFAMNLILNEILELEIPMIKMTHHYLWAMCQSPLYISVAAISIQRLRKILSTFTPRPNKVFKTAALITSWFSAIPQLIFVYFLTECKFVCTSHEHELCNFSSIYECVTLFILLICILIMISTYSCAIWYLKYRVRQKYRNHESIELAHITKHNNMVGHFKSHSLEESAMRRSTKGPRSSTTMTYKLAKQVLMINGIPAGTIKTSKDTESVTTCVESFPGPSVLTTGRRMSEFRRRSSLDVSTIYSVRHSSDIKSPPVRSTKLSLPGCISPDEEEALSVSGKFEPKWHMKRSARDVEHPRNGRISEESMVSPAMNYDNRNWADPITPPFESQRFTDPFSEGIVPNSDMLVSNGGNNCLSPFLGSDRMKIFSISSLSSDGESVSRLSPTSFNSRRGSSLKNSRPIEAFLNAIRASRNAASGKDSANIVTVDEEEKSDDLPSLKKETEKQNENQADDTKKELYPESATSKKTFNFGSQFMRQISSSSSQTISNLPSSVTDLQTPDDISKSRQTLKSLLRPKKNKRGKSQLKHRSISPNKGTQKGSSPKKAATTALPPLRHERLCASGAPIVENPVKEEQTNPVQKIEETISSNTDDLLIQHESEIKEKKSEQSLVSKKSNSVVISNKDHSVCMSVKKDSKVSNIANVSRRRTSQRSELDIFQFLAESGKKECLLSRKLSSASRNRKVSRKKLHHSDPTGFPLAPKRLLAKFSTPATLFRRSHIYPHPGMHGKVGKYYNKPSFPDKRGGAYHATKKASWLVFYFITTMLPLACVKLMHPKEESLNAFTQALAYVCFVINPFSYILSNKNLLTRPRITDFRKHFIN